jgi:pimeloyl-ACP methyl ester carboxylesterase
MPLLQNNAVRIHYEVHGSGQPVVLLHGATVNFTFNYTNFGWTRAFVDAGMQVIGLDFRGHGDSDKPHEADSYGTANLAADVLAVLDHLDVPHVSVVAYSLGTAVALHLMHMAGRRIGKAALIATGDGLIGHAPHTFANMFPALIPILDRTEYPHDVPRHLAAYWSFINATGADKKALRALSQGEFPPLPVEKASTLSIPTLVIGGENDVVLGRAPRLAQALGNAQYREIAGADHFSLAADANVQAAVVDFLVPPASQGRAR